MQDAKTSSKAAYQPLPSEKASSVAPAGTGGNKDLFSNIDALEDKNDGPVPIKDIEEVQSSISHGGTGG